MRLVLVFALALVMASCMTMGKRTQHLFDDRK
jgi:hypothetical protein